MLNQLCIGKVGIGLQDHQGYFTFGRKITFTTQSRGLQMHLSGPVSYTHLHCLCWLNRLIYIAVDREILRANPIEDVAYEIASGDWSSDVCSSDLRPVDMSGRKVLPTLFVHERSFTVKPDSVSYTHLDGGRAVRFYLVTVDVE